MVIHAELLIKLQRNLQDAVVSANFSRAAYGLWWLVRQSLLPILLVVSLSGCATMSPVAPSELPHKIDSGQQADTLYQRLGGRVVLEQLVDNFVKGIAADKQVLPYFAKSNVTRFRLMFIEHLCEVSDGPCRYQGDSMRDIHTGMHINEADFNRVVELLVIAMEQTKISYPLQNQLLARLAPLRNGIIGI